MYIGATVIAVLVALAIILPLTLSGGSAEKQRGSSVLNEVPLIDGHNDLPNNLYSLLGNQLNNFKFDSDLTTDPVFGSLNSSHTDLPRLKEGHVGGQFWVAYVDCKTQHKDAVERTLQQIDVIKRLVQAHPNHLHYATTADGRTSLYEFL